MQTAFVTGACGFIGSHLLQQLSESGVRVYALCRPQSSHIDRIRGIANVHIIEQSLDELNTINCIHDDIDVIYHLAWNHASGELRSSFQAQLANVTHIPELVTFAQKRSCRKIIVTGTVSENLSDRITDFQMFTSSAYYLFTKSYLYNVLRQLSYQTGIALVWMTFCHPIGKYNKSDQFIAAAIKKLAQGEVVKLGKGTNIFDIVAVEDLANALYLAGTVSLSHDRYFVGSGNPETIMSYMEQVRAIINPSGIIEYGAILTDNLDLEEDWLDCSQFSRETGYVPKVPFNIAVQQTAEWLRLTRELVPQENKFRL